MADSVDLGYLWAELGLIDARELVGGFQSRVFKANRAGESLAVKVVDADLVDEAEWTRRVEIANWLAQRCLLVPKPVALGGRIVDHRGCWLVAASEFAPGKPVDISQRREVRLMAEALAATHKHLARYPTCDLPLVAPLRTPGAEVSIAGLDRQLLHGDFGSPNVLIDTDHAAVLDFGECGYGPIEFELGNTMFMTEFDCRRAERRESFTRFRRWFLTTYSEAVERDVDDETVDAMADLRRGALQYWLGHLHDAPIGIRTSSAAWRAELHEVLRTW